MVLVDRRNLTIKAGNNRSLNNKYIGPYKIIDKKGSYAYKLQIPARMCLHSVIHASLLKPHQGGRHMEIDKEDEPLYNVEKIINTPSLLNTNVQDGRSNQIARFYRTSTSLLHVFTCYLIDKTTFTGANNIVRFGLAGALSISHFPTRGVPFEETVLFLVILTLHFLFSFSPGGILYEWRQLIRPTERGFCYF